MYLALGKFDAPDRMFHDLEQCFSSVNTNHADVKELIPEFYDPNAGFDFLINTRGLQLGTTQNGERVNDVILPPWARSGRDFIRKNRKALESDKCSEMLPRWIDLIFGYKSRGEEAKKASNLFHRMAYMGPSDLKDMKTEEEKIQAELQATEFGIVPDILFRDPHPPKGSSMIDEDFRLIAVDINRAINEGSGETESHESFKGFENLKVNASGDQPWELLEATEDHSSRKVTAHSKGESSSNGFSAVFSEDSPSIVTRKKFVEKTLSSSNEKNTMNFNDKMYKSTEPVSRGGRAKASWNSNLTYRNRSFRDNINNSIGFNDKKNDNDKGRLNNGISRSTKRPENLDSPHGINNSSLLSEKNEAFVNGKGNKIKISSATESLDKNKINTSLSSNSVQSLPHDGWDMKVICKKMIHGDCISGCSLLVQKSVIHIITVSLDGCLMVHKISPDNRESNRVPQKRSFYGTKAAVLVGKTRLPFRSSINISNSSTKQEQKIDSYRTHASTDPLACMDITSDETGGHIVFAGGHNDGVVAYGINSACALASVYSHRDAVTGLNLMPKSAFGESSTYSDGTSLPTHVMITGSWDATLKCWSVVLAADETVSINREPLVELFDADASIVCISSVDLYGSGVAICAGCADGSFVIWLFRLDGGKIDCIETIS